MHLEALKSGRKRVFEKLKKFPEFYLTGETALALQIGHRLSVDFDLFLEKEISPNLIRRVRQVFKGSEIELILNVSEQLSVRVDGIRIDFVKYKFPLILKPVEFWGVRMARVPEIAAMKAYALNYRGTLKDYVDLYFLLKDKYTTFKEVKKIAEKKYKNEFNFRLLLEQLIYLKDIKREKIEFLKEKITQETMLKFFNKEVKKIKLL